MQLDKLQIALRPRPAAQALDLGFALLRAHAAAVYKVWLALWLSAMALAGALAVLAPDWVFVWILLPWWVRPLLERGPLYVFSRQVFGVARMAWPAGRRLAAHADVVAAVHAGTRPVPADMAAGAGARPGCC
jgi:hypothetical protein